MKLWLVVVHIVLVGCFVWTNASEEFADNDFAEFEDFDSDEEPLQASNKEFEDSMPSTVEHQTQTIDDEMEIVVDEDVEYEHFKDAEEFEGYNTARQDEEKGSEKKKPDLQFNKLPMHFRANWDSYWLEILMIGGLLVYFINFATGKSKNSKVANAWFATHRTLLEDNFAMVGDDGAIENKDANGMIKESENIFTLWCSGRTCCEGMLVELKLIKRQDLIAVIAGLMRPVVDQIQMKVTMNKEDMDTFVFAVASKKTAAHLTKELADLSVYCPERKSGDKFNIPNSFNVMSEIAEATSAMLDSKLTTILNKYSEYIDYIHFSDQYSGAKQPEDNGALKLPDTQKVLIFNFNVPMKGVGMQEAMDQLKPVMTLVFYCIEKVKRYRLSKEGKSKADKNRTRVEEAFLKSTHAARAEAAAARREEKRRQEKEKVMADDDPERQRRWEEKEQKRQVKKRAPKMKQLKVKAL